MKNPPAGTEATPFSCKKCDQVFVSKHDLSKHVQSEHKDTTLNYCPNCDFLVQDEKSLKEHMIQYHESSVVLYTLAKQIDDIYDGLAKLEPFQKDSTVLLNDIKSTQNEIKQELFLIRNEQIDVQRRPKHVEKDDGKKRESKTYASVVSPAHKHQPSRERRRSEKVDKASEDGKKRRSANYHDNKDQRRNDYSHRSDFHRRPRENWFMSRPNYNRHNRYPSRFSKERQSNSQPGPYFRPSNGQSQYHQHHFPQYSRNYHQYNSPHEMNFMVPTSNRFSCLGNY